MAGEKIYAWEGLIIHSFIHSYAWEGLIRGLLLGPPDWEAAYDTKELLLLGFGMCLAEDLDEPGMTSVGGH